MYNLYAYIYNANFSKTALVFYLPLKMFFRGLCCYSKSTMSAKLAPGHLNCPVVPIYIGLVIAMRLSHVFILCLTI